MSLISRHLRRQLRSANVSPQRFNSTTTTAAAPKVIFSGIQPTGVPHLGNYLGALRQWVDIQDSAAPDTKLIFSVVDLHAITQALPPDQLRQWKREMLAAILAIGIDPKRSIVFEQSRVMHHAELMWILSCGASTGYLSRMTQWKVRPRPSRSASACDLLKVCGRPSWASARTTPARLAETRPRS